MIGMRLSEAAAVLQGQYHGADVAFRGCGLDTRRLDEGALFVALRGERQDGHDYVVDAFRSGAAAVMVEKGPVTEGPCLQVAATRPAMGRLAAHWRASLPVSLVAVTGSNGKTTVKQMVASILSKRAPSLASRGNWNNDLGVPLTLFQLGKKHRYAVIEMGANHCGEISNLAHMAQPMVAAVTQCAPAHLAGFGDLDSVARAKGEIYQELPDAGTAVINADDVYAPLWESMAECRHHLRFAVTAQEAEIRAENISTRDEAAGGRSFTLTTPSGRASVSLAMPGQHNVMNALCAAACATALGLDPEEIAAGLNDTRPVPGRLQILPGLQGGVVIDDSYNANPTSLQAGLSVMRARAGQHWLVLGDMLELGKEEGTLHAQAGLDARAAGVSRLFAYGALAARAADSFGAAGSAYTDMDALCADLRSQMGADVVVLVKGSRSGRMERVVKALRQEGESCC